MDQILTPIRKIEVKFLNCIESNSIELSLWSLFEEFYTGHWKQVQNKVKVDTKLERGSSLETAYRKTPASVIFCLALVVDAIVVSEKISSEMHGHWRTMVHSFRSSVWYRGPLTLYPKASGFRLMWTSIPFHWPGIILLWFFIECLLFCFSYFD